MKTQIKTKEIRQSNFIFDKNNFKKAITTLIKGITK